MLKIFREILIRLDAIEMSVDELKIKTRKLERQSKATATTKKKVARKNEK